MEFFNTGKSNFTYLSIWYTFDSKAIVWVANRDRLASDKKGVLSFVAVKKLIIRNESSSLVWSSNVSGSSINTAAKLWNNGNFVLSRDDRIGDINRAPSFRIWRVIEWSFEGRAV